VGRRGAATGQHRAPDLHLLLKAGERAGESSASCRDAHGTSFAGHTDWRARDVKELRAFTLQNFSPAVLDRPFNNTQGRAARGCPVLPRRPLLVVYSVGPKRGRANPSRLTVRMVVGFDDGNVHGVE